MRLISHRANINGKNKATENSPEAIDHAIRLGFDVEIDIWFVDGKWSLGHDQPTYPIELEWLEKRKHNLWIHCKNIGSIVNLKDTSFHYFWHENDTLTITSKGMLWVFPGKQPVKGSIAVMPEIHNDDIRDCFGICSDSIIKYQH